MMTMLAIKFIPILLGEANRIIRAQSARGVDFESGGFFQRVKNLLPILTPLFHSVFKRADDLAIALLARGYISGARTHSMRPEWPGGLRAGLRGGVLDFGAKTRGVGKTAFANGGGTRKGSLDPSALRPASFKKESRERKILTV
jgi:hypothetical protein